MMLVRYLSLFGFLAAAQNGWCGQAECAAQPQCLNTAVDIMVAMDQSCSMNAGDFILEGNFSSALSSAAQKQFNISRFAGAQFGFAVNFNANPIPVSSKIFAHMQSNATAFQKVIPTNFTGNCGGTPTDEALALFFEELNSTRIANRMQVAILLTDGQPTLCSTAGGTCDGTSNGGNVATATAASTAERWRPNKLPSLGALVFTIGIGASVNSALLTNYSSSPRMFFQATDFQALVTNTLPKVLDQLCFYAITGTSSCPASGQVYRIKAYNFFPLSSPAKCRFQEIGTSNYYYTPASINVTTEKFLNETGLVSYVTCNTPNVSYDFSALLEISREGVYYTANEFKAVVRRQCNATNIPLCPGAALENFFKSCTESEFTNGTCSAGCAQASVLLGNAFQSPDFLFTAATITECITNFPGTFPTSVRALVANLTKPGVGPCPSADNNPTTSGAVGLFASSMGLLLLLAASLL